MAGFGGGAGSLDVLVRFVGDTKKLQSSVNDVQKTGGKIKGWASGVGGAIAGGFAVAGVAAFGKASVSAAQESEVATARLENIFGQMGDTTGTAAKEAEKYAGVLSKKIGVDDEEIMAAQALLATFADVSSETARQSGIFDRATNAAADLAAAGYGNLEGNAKQLGKALNDPLKGTAALRKAGIQLTDAQQDQIKHFVKIGDKLSAQKIIMGEVEHQVKGTAAATATGSEKMNVAWGETQESVGKALLPILEKLLPIITAIAGIIEKNASVIVPLALVLGGLAIAFKIASAASALFGVTTGAAFLPVLAIIAGIAALIVVAILIVKHWDKIKAAGLAVWRFMQRAWDSILNLIKGVWEWIKRNWPLLLAILTGPFGVAVLLIVKNWDKIKEGVRAAFDFIKDLWGKLLHWLTLPFTEAWSIIKGVWDKITGIVSKAVDIGKDLADGVKKPINALIRAWNAIEFKIPGFDPPGPGPKFGGFTLGLPDIPELAKGGLVTRTGLAEVHRGETFSGVGRGAGTVVNINVTTEGLGASAPQIQRAVANALRNYTERNGPLDIAVRG